MGKRSDEVTGADPIDPAVDGSADATNMASNAGYSAGLAGMPYSEGDPELYTEQVEVSAGYAPAPDLETGELDDETALEVEDTRAAIEQTRSEMSGTIDAIQQKLSPSNMVQEAKNTVRDATIGKAQDMVDNATDTARGYGSSFVETIRENPIPAALAGIGLGWLFMSARKSGNRHSGTPSGYPYRPNAGYDQYGYTRERDWDDQYRAYNYGNTGSSQGITDRAAGMAGQAQSAVSDAAGTVRDTATQTVNQVQNTAGQAFDQAQNTAGQFVSQAQDVASQAAYTAQDTAQQLANQAQQGVYQARSSFQRMMDTNPLAVGVIALGAGAAIGLAIPETEMENELMGEQRDQVVDQAQSTAQDMAQRAKNVAQQAVGAATETAKSEAQSQGLTGSSSDQSSST